MDKPYKVYMYTSPVGKRYIGITKQTIKNRAQRNGIGYRYCPAFWKAIQKYGWDNFRCVVLFDNLDKEEAEAKEIELIKLYKSNEGQYGYNIENGGNCYGTHSAETRAKISKANKGRTFSPETIEKIRAALIGRPRKDGNQCIKYLLTEESKRKHSEKMAGNQFFKGKHHSEAFKHEKSLQMKAAYSGGRNPRCKRVIVSQGETEKEYFSLREAARQNNISPAHALSLIRNGGDSCGAIWRYKDEKRT